MRITNIRVYQHDLVVAGGLYEMSTSEVASLDTTVVVIETDTGLLGFGETCPLGPTYQPQHALGARAAIAEVAPALIGLDPRQPSVVYAAMNAALSGIGLRQVRNRCGLLGSSRQSLWRTGG